MIFLASHQLRSNGNRFLDRYAKNCNTLKKAFKGELMLRHIKRLSTLWFVLAIVSLVGTILLYQNYQRTYNRFVDDAQKNALKVTKKASLELDQFIIMLKPLAESFAKQLGEKNYTKEEIVQLIKDKKPVEVAGFGVNFLPYKVDKDTKLFGRNYMEQGGKQNMIAIEDEFDYTKPEYTWFWDPIKKGAHFLEPYFGPSSKTILAEYSAPIYRTDSKGNKEAIGIVFANQSVEHLQHILDTLFLGKSGYWFILTPQGKYLAHPQSKYIHKGYTIYDVAKDLNNPGLAEIAKEITAGKEVVFEYNNEITGFPSWLISDTIAGTPWSIVGIFDKGPLPLDQNILRRKLIHPSISFFLFILFSTLFVMALKHTGKAFSWWIAMSIISLGFLIQIVWIWYVIREFHYEQEADLQVVESKTQLYEYLEKEGTLYRYGEQITKKKE